MSDPTLWLVIGLALATLASEDLACISAGLLIGRGEIGWAAALTACAVGIYLGDAALWCVGRTSLGLIERWPWAARRLSPEKLAAASAWLDQRTFRVIFAARFLPGTRTVTYIAAGALGRRTAAFFLWSLIAVALWTPLLIGAAFIFRERVAGPLEAYTGATTAMVLAAGLMLVLVRLVRNIPRHARQRLIARVSKLWRWEFWPMWLFYIPVAPWIAWLALRHGGLRLITAVNPGIPLGGLFGESKYHILSRLPGEWIAPADVIEPGDAADRLRLVEQAAGRFGWPLILKPDVGERGSAVRLVHCIAEASDYLAAHRNRVIVQQYHEGPCEAGVFYVRHPDQPRGCIFSITDKYFPHILGDGISTFEELILSDARLRMQAGVFLARHAVRRRHVLPAGQSLRLSMAGNHCQGTMFLDGAHLITPELEAVIDRIARHFDGFYFGRFDIRYTSADELRAGRGFRIVELNGATSESTNIYDPRNSLLTAYRTLYRQWRLLFEIAAANVAHGHRPADLGEIIRAYREYRRTPTLGLIAD